MPEVEGDELDDAVQEENGMVDGLRKELWRVWWRGIHWGSIEGAAVIERGSSEMEKTLYIESPFLFSTLIYSSNFL